jgi:hypothetical protein
MLLLKIAHLIPQGQMRFFADLLVSLPSERRSSALGPPFLMAQSTFKFKLHQTQSLALHPEFFSRNIQISDVTPGVC